MGVPLASGAGIETLLDRADEARGRVETRLCVGTTIGIL